MAFDTVANIVSEAAVEVGLSAPSDVFGSTDQNIIQLRTYLKSLGQDLVGEHRWTQLLREATITTSNGDNDYDLPADFDRMADQSAWDRTNDWPLAPVDSIGWQQFQATSVAGTFWAWFRIVEGEIRVYPTPTSARTIAYEYVSAYWVQPSGQSTTTASAPTANTDTLWFDRRLLVAGIKLRWLEGKGLPADAAMREFTDALAKATIKHEVAPVLSLTRRRPTGLMGVQNVPETGYGS